MAVFYWHLGKALVMARNKYKHGSWGNFLESLGVNKTRASKAQAIYKANRAEKEVGDLSVAKAYARRKQKKTKRQKAGPAVMSDKAELREFLKGICIEAERYYDVAAFLKPPEESHSIGCREDYQKAKGNPRSPGRACGAVNISLSCGFSRRATTGVNTGLHLNSIAIGVILIADWLSFG